MPIDGKAGRYMYVDRSEFCSIISGTQFTSTYTYACLAAIWILRVLPTDLVGYVSILIKFRDSVHLIKKL